VVIAHLPGASSCRQPTCRL